MMTKRSAARSPSIRKVRSLTYLITACLMYGEEERRSREAIQLAGHYPVAIVIGEIPPRLPGSAGPRGPLATPFRTSIRPIGADVFPA
jgi:hypothetical protein